MPPAPKGSGAEVEAGCGTTAPSKAPSRAAFEADDGVITGHTVPSPVAFHTNSSAPSIITRALRDAPRNA